MKWCLISSIGFTPHTVLPQLNGSGRFSADASFFPARQGCCQRNSARTDDFCHVIEVYAHNSCDCNTSVCFPHVFAKNFVNLIHDIWKLIQRLFQCALLPLQMLVTLPTSQGQVNLFDSCFPFDQRNIMEVLNLVFHEAYIFLTELQKKGK